MGEVSLSYPGGLCRGAFHRKKDFLVDRELRPRAKECSWYLEMGKGDMEFQKGTMIVIFSAEQG